MAKKIVAALLIATIAGMYAAAQDAAKPAGPAAPKTGISLTQIVETDTWDQVSSQSLYTGNSGAVYSQTSVKGQVEFDLGGGFKMTPSITERLETRLNSYFANNTGATTGTAANFRNRVYAALNNTLAIDKAFNLGLNLEYRVESTFAQSTPSRVVPTAQFTPTLNFNGKIADLVYYNLSQGLNYQFDNKIVTYATENWVDDTRMNLPGTYNVGLQFALDQATSLKIDLTDDLTINWINDAKQDNANNKFRAKVFLVAGDLTPSVGFLMYNAHDKSDVEINNIVGASAGVDLKVGSNATFGVNADFGQDSSNYQKDLTKGKNIPNFFDLTATLVIKY